MPSKGRLVAVLSALTFFTYGFRLDHSPLQPWDEAIYADAARNVLDGNVIILKLSGVNHNLPPGTFLEKPPFVPWLQAISIGLFGDTAMAARIPSFLAFVGCVALTGLIAARVMNYRAGVVAGILLIFSSVATASHGPLYGSTDVILTLFGSVAVWEWVKYQRGDQQRKSRLYISSAALAIALLSKGVAAIVFAIVALPALFWRVETLRSREFWSGVGLCAVVALPWFFIAYAIAGEVFIQQFFVEQVVKRSTGEFGIDQGGILPWMRYPYFTRGPQFLGLGLAGIVCLGVGRTIFESMRQRQIQFQPITLFFIYWGATFPIVYAMLGGNQPWYIIPSAVPLAILGAWSVEEMLHHKPAVSDDC